MATLSDVLADLERMFPSQPVSERGNAEGLQFIVGSKVVKLKRQAIKSATVDELRAMIEGQMS